MRTCLVRLLAMVSIVAVAACAEFRSAPDLSRHLVAAAPDVLERVRSRPDFQRFLGVLDNAKAVMIFPALIKAGLIGGAEGGSGVLLVRRDDGSWSYPAFYTLAAGSVGLQMGIQDTEVVMAIRSQGAIESILKHQGKLGADMGITVGTMGAGAEAATTTNLGADVVVFVNANLGAYAGASFEGSMLVRRNDLNQAYYGQPLEPRDIVLGGAGSNPHADALRGKLARRG